MLMRISRYFFLLYLIKAHLDSFSRYGTRFRESTLETYIDSGDVTYNNFIINKRLLKEHSHCDAWSEWSACSKTCDYGVKIRVRISTDEKKSQGCQNITESTICHIQICPETYEEAEKTYLHNKENEQKKKLKTKYILIFTIFSVINIIVLLICLILSIKKKII
ncbi:thrombospondin-related sporozoite protein [Plasmodium gaboni]|uniref:Thrombospondin-related sporozoite protein n=1 Tax=Plasmodium gaboni TaxID=647221 RepID=A0A151LWY9_9APIC|nr:thrombospondin-related sporozoite protein [Plasmodium gaboni]KYO03686.1 thrombospondin-related sporozoite protein [Plasmodium gaboni]